MNLWTIVLLGILAQTSNGCYELSYEKLENEINAKLSDAITGINTQNTLPGFAIAGQQIVPLIKGIASVETVSIHLGDNKWSFNCSAIITIGSGGFSDLQLKLSVYGELEAVLEHGYLNFKLLAGKLLINLAVKTPVIQTIITASLVGAYTENCKLLVLATIQPLCQSGLQALNVAFRKSTYYFTFLGNTWWYQANKLSFLSDSLVLYVDMVENTVDGVTNIPFYVSSLTTSGLQVGWSALVYIADSLIAGIINVLHIDFRRSLTSAEFEAYQIFAGVVGAKVVLVQQQGPFDYKITPGESKATAVLHLSLWDGTENLLTKFELDVSLNLDISRRGGRLWFALGSFTKLSVSLLFVDPRCSCNDDPITYLESLIDYSISAAIGNWKCQFEQPFPDPIQLPFVPEDSDCIYGDAVLQCGA